MSQHEHELEDLADRLENEKSRQLLALRDKMATRRQRKLEDLRRKHDVDLTKEMLEQKKELNEVRQKKAKDAEYKAIVEGIKDNGAEESDKVIKAVLAKRQAQVITVFISPLLRGVEHTPRPLYNTVRVHSINRVS